MTPLFFGICCSLVYLVFIDRFNSVKVRLCFSAFVVGVAWLIQIVLFKIIELMAMCITYLTNY